jgi:hypothetical protein
MHILGIIVAATALLTVHINHVEAMHFDALTSEQIIEAYENKLLSEKYANDVEEKVVSAPVAVRASVSASAGSVEARVREYFADAPVMQEVAWCESKFVHYLQDGTTLRGHVVSSDIGVMQVNEYYHGATSRTMGIDIHTLEGNLAYARYLYERQGTQPWNASRHCWEKRTLALN